MGLSWFHMKFRPSSRSLRSFAVAAGILVLGLLLAGAFSFGKGQERKVEVFQGSACLPLSGELAGAGDAFRAGFTEGLGSVPDSHFVWRWSWADNGSDPLLAQAWADSVGRSNPPDLLLAGLGAATEGLHVPRRESDSTKLPGGRNEFLTKSVPCLLLGDGSPVREGIWNLWPTTARMRSHLVELLREAKKPVVVVVAATGSWADIVLSDLRDSLPGLVILPHDLDNARWDEEIRRLWETRPGTVLFWDRPHEASALLAKPLARGALRRAELFVPEGTSVPESLGVSVMAPVWQPGTPPDSLQCLRYRAWGRLVGESLARATRLALSDSLGDLLEAIRKLPPDPRSRESWSQGWSPILVARNPAPGAPQPDSGH
jgi:hypothetical protein